MNRGLVLGFTADDVVGGGQDVRLASAYTRALRHHERSREARIEQAAGDHEHVLVWFVNEVAACVLDAASVDWRSFVVDVCAGPPRDPRRLFAGTDEAMP